MCSGMFFLWFCGCDSRMHSASSAVNGAPYPAVRNLVSTMQRLRAGRGLRAGGPELRLDFVHLFRVDDERLYAVLVELRPRELAQPGKGLIVSPRRLVGARAGEGVEDVRDGNDTRL